ncbi:hypothetical protein DAERI_060130 [Deinococcus aerius]|uniref:Uncharacterized protein n=1 Tax=Deinococcus aerius TaxID=200253 RepID=A0A2I9D637_9DEIO|nr:hypothetical protein [Deinococcus aerius]GBF05870.1 hypothetical protein DAERI_060130 [Deinococcus aerius]
MNRSERVLDVMRAEPGRGWGSTGMSVTLNCAPAMARKVMLRLVGKGDLTVGEALTHLVALYRAGRIDLWASLPQSQEAWDEQRR